MWASPCRATCCITWTASACRLRVEGCLPKSTTRRLPGRPLPPLITALVILTAAGIVRPAQDAPLIKEARPRSQALNAWSIDRPPAVGESGYLASPVTGGGVAVSRSEVLFLQSLRDGSTCPEDWARFAWADFSRELSAIPASTPIAAGEEKLTALTDEAKVFGERRLPVLRALEVA